MKDPGCASCFMLTKRAHKQTQLSRVSSNLTPPWKLSFLAVRCLRYTRNRCFRVLFSTKRLGTAPLWESRCGIAERGASIFFKHTRRAGFFGEPPVVISNKLERVITMHLIVLKQWSHLAHPGSARTGPFCPPGQLPRLRSSCSKAWRPASRKARPCSGTAARLHRFPCVVTRLHQKGSLGGDARRVAL